MPLGVSSNLCPWHHYGETSALVLQGAEKNKSGGNSSRTPHGMRSFQPLGLGSSALSSCYNLLGTWSAWAGCWGSLMGGALLHCLAAFQAKKSQLPKHQSLKKHRREREEGEEESREDTFPPWHVIMATILLTSIPVLNTDLLLHWIEMDTLKLC